MNAVSKTRPENLPVKSGIPVSNHLLKSKIPVPVHALRLSNVNDKKKSTISEKKSSVSAQPLISKKTTTSQKSCAPVEKIKNVTKTEKAAPRNKIAMNCEPKSVCLKAEQILKENNKSTKVNKISNKLAATKKLSQVDKKISSKNKLNNNNEKKSVAKENKDPLKPEPDHIASQKDIKFEANEFYRKLILSERELSPSILKLQSGVKLSAVQCERPSVYKKFELSDNPYQDAIKELEKLSLSKKKTPSVKRESKPPLPGSPFKVVSLNRQSFYTPCSNPKEELLRSLQLFEEKRMLKKIKSTKKVTFNLTKDSSPKAFNNRIQTPFRSSEGQLTQIIEKSEENTPNSPRSKANEVLPVTSTEQSNLQTSVCNKSERNSTLCTISKPASVMQQNCADEHHKTAVSENSELCTPMTKVAVVASSNTRENAKISRCGNLSGDTERKYANSSIQSVRNPDCSVSPPDFLRDNVKDLPLKYGKHNSVFTSVSKNEAEQDFQYEKIYTPRPVSFYLNSRLIDTSSPEFLVNDANRRLSQYAPIRTPLVLKSLAKSPEAMSVRLKLDFTEEEKDSPKKLFTKPTPLFNLEKIETLQKKLEKLADDECRLLFVNENSTPVICGRYLWNPVAQTLTEGDEMHFIPISF